MEGVLVVMEKDTSNSSTNNHDRDKQSCTMEESHRSHTKTSKATFGLLLSTRYLNE